MQIGTLCIGVILLSCGAPSPAVYPSSPSDNLTAVISATDNRTTAPHVSDNSAVRLSPPSIAASGQIGFQIGDTAPDFTLKTPDGRDIKLSDYIGKNVLLHFWDIGCPKCVEEMPHIQKVWEAHRAADDLVVLAVNLGGSAEGVETFMKSYGYTFPALLDSDRVVNRLYDEPCCPGTYLIDAKGIIKSVKTGAFKDTAEIEEALKSL
ncbi:MAG TPA: thiol-disulfide oxidoreductase [Dehalococcoidia bacterium]|nr:thiol-disulfide oxidoreductase [Dehalococcoidia bacterium]